MNSTTQIAIALLTTLLALSTPLEAKLYRWVDAEGNVHYSDKVPAQHADQARSELNKSGITVGREEAAKTAEEIAREKELKALREQQQLIIEQQRAKDRVLLRTFRTEDDLLMGRNGKLAAIDANIHITRSNIRRLKEKLSDMQKSAAAAERQGRKLSVNLRKDIENTRTQLKDSYALVITREQEKEAIRSEAMENLARFRILKHLNPLEGDEGLQNVRQASLLDTVVSCDNERACDLAWQKVEAYVRRNSTTRMQMLSQQIVMTAAPLKDDDLSLTVSRILRKGEPGAEIFMDMQCKQSPRGIDFCNDEKVESIRLGFRPFISQD